MFFLTNVCMALDPTNAVPYTLTLTVENADVLGVKKYGFIAICNPENTAGNPVVDSNNDANYVILTATLNPSWIGDSHIISWTANDRLIPAGANKRKVKKDQWMKELQITVKSSFKTVEHSETVSLVGCKIIYKPGTNDIVQSLEDPVVHKTDVVFHSYPPGRDVKVKNSSGITIIKVNAPDLVPTVVTSGSDFDTLTANAELSPESPGWSNFSVDQELALLASDNGYSNNNCLSKKFKAYKFAREEMVGTSTRLQRMSAGSASIKFEISERTFSRPSDYYEIANPNAPALISVGSACPVIQGDTEQYEAPGLAKTIESNVVFYHLAISPNEKGKAKTSDLATKYIGTGEIQCNGNYLAYKDMPLGENTTHVMACAGVAFGYKEEGSADYSKWDTVTPETAVGFNKDYAVTTVSMGINASAGIPGSGGVGLSVGWSATFIDKKIANCDTPVTASHNMTKAFGEHKALQELKNKVFIRVGTDAKEKIDGDDDWYIKSSACGTFKEIEKMEVVFTPSL